MSKVGFRRSDVSDLHFVSIDDHTSEAYCHIVSDIATVTLQSRHTVVTASTAEILWQAITASGTRRSMYWGVCQEIIRRLLQDFQATRGPRESGALGAYVRLKDFAGGDAPRSVDGIELWHPNVLVQNTMRPDRPSSPFARRKQKKTRSDEEPVPSVIDGEDF